MDNFKKNIDKLVSRILNEEIENKVKQIAEEMGEWTEIKVDEDLTGGQSKLDVAEPKGKLTAADFKKLRDSKSSKKEVDEFFFDDDENEEEENAEELSSQEPTYVGKGLEGKKPRMIGSFDDDHGWFDHRDKQIHPDELEDYDEENFPDVESLLAKHGNRQPWFSGDNAREMFRSYQNKFGGKPFRVRIPKLDVEEQECDECGGTMYESKDEKWIQKTDMKKGSLHKTLGVPEGDKIPVAKLKSLKKELTKKSEGDKKLSAADLKLLKQVNLALTLKDIKESKDTLKLTEDELIDMIEKIVLEQKVKDKAEIDNISKKEPEGLKKTNKVLELNKKENEDYSKEVVKKMKDYLKDATKAEYDENPERFPESNYTLDKDSKIAKYDPSEAVDEYIEAFAYPGQTNIVFDEIKPDDKKITKYLEGDSTTGNAVVDKKGKALGNVVPSKAGERFKKNYDENLYGAEQMKASYKRQSQPVDIAGGEKIKGSLKNAKKSSIDKASSILNQLESTEDKASKIISEEMVKMKDLISYNRKTQ